MPEKIEVANPYKKPLDARKVMDKLAKVLGVKPLVVIADNSRWVVIIKFPEKPSREIVQKVEKALRDKNLYEGD